MKHPGITRLILLACLEASSAFPQAAAKTDALLETMNRQPWVQSGVLEKSADIASSVHPISVSLDSVFQCSRRCSSLRLIHVDNPDSFPQNSAFKGKPFSVVRTRTYYIYYVVFDSTKGAVDTTYTGQQDSLPRPYDFPGTRFLSLVDTQLVCQYRYAMNLMVYDKSYSVVPEKPVNLHPDSLPISMTLKCRKGYFNVVEQSLEYVPAGVSTRVLVYGEDQKTGSGWDLKSMDFTALTLSPLDSGCTYTLAFPAQ